MCYIASCSISIAPHKRREQHAGNWQKQHLNFLFSTLFDSFQVKVGLNILPSVFVFVSCLVLEADESGMSMEGEMA